jgi:hypothetical protein
MVCSSIANTFIRAHAGFELLSVPNLLLLLLQARPARFVER